MLDWLPRMHKALGLIPVLEKTRDSYFRLLTKAQILSYFPSISHHGLFSNAGNHLRCQDNKVERIMTHRQIAICPT